jgi:hypothetical protein
VFALEIDGAQSDASRIRERLGDVVRAIRVLADPQPQIQTGDVVAEAE